MSNFRCTLSQENLSLLYAWYDTFLPQSGKRLFYDSLSLEFEGSDFRADFEQRQHSIKICLHVLDEHRMTANITDFVTSKGKKVYFDFVPGVTEYEKRWMKDTLQFILGCMEMLNAAYTSKAEGNPFSFATETDATTGEEILLMKPFVFGRNPEEIRIFRKSPEEPFAVKGHYRHLKSGKVVWVKGYTKGNRDE